MPDKTETKLETLFRNANDSDMMDEVQDIYFGDLAFVWDEPQGEEIF